MQPFHSTETRWFFSEAAHDAKPYRKWFQQLPGAQIAEQAERTDYYYRLKGSSGFGIKLRGEGEHGKIETKEQVQLDGLVHFSKKIAGEVQHWIKWSFPIETGFERDEHLFEKNWLGIRKKRWLCMLEIVRQNNQQAEIRFSDPSIRISDGVQLEFAEVTAGEEAWFSIGLEAFGSPAFRKTNLDLGAQFLAGTLSENISFPPEHSMSYYAWLTQQVL